MQLVIGVDLVSVPRFKWLLARYGTLFSERIFTPFELAVYGPFPMRLAARFAAKEAVGKALGVGLAHMTRYGIPANHIETRNLPGGAPILHLYGLAQERAIASGITHMEISLSHNPDFATATVIGFGQ